MQIEMMFGSPVRARIAGVGRGVLRWGLIALLVLWGVAKFGEAEANAIQPLVEHSPLLRWLYPLLGVRGGSDVIGLVELAAAALMATRRWRPAWSAVGSLISAATFAMTLSFLFTTPGVLSPDNPFGGFLMKDVILFGAALATAAEALEAAAARRVR